MTGGSSPIGYLKAWHTDLYLSADAEKVREALAEGEHATHVPQKQKSLNIICDTALLSNVIFIDFV